MARIDIDGPDVDYDESQLLLYRGEPFTGEAVEFGADGKLWTLKTFAEGYAEGPFKQWFADGRLEMEGVNKRNHAVGEWREWLPDGRLKRTDSFDGEGNLLARTEWGESGAIVKRYSVSEAEAEAEADGGVRLQ